MNDCLIVHFTARLISEISLATWTVPWSFPRATRKSGSQGWPPPHRQSAEMAFDAYSQRVAIGSGENACEFHNHGLPAEADGSGYLFSAANLPLRQRRPNSRGLLGEERNLDGQHPLFSRSRSLACIVSSPLQPGITAGTCMACPRSMEAGRM